MREKTFLLTRVLIFFFLMLSFQSILGQERKKSLSLGLGSSYREFPYQGMASQFNPFPLVQFSYGRFSLRGPNVRFAAIENKLLSLILSPDFSNGYDPREDSTIFAGMSERKGTMNFGVGSQFKISRLSFSYSYQKDILGTHGGGRLRLGSSFGLPLGIFLNKFLKTKSFPFSILKLGVNFQYDSESFANYYFGVQSQEATTDRSSYFLSGFWTRRFQVSLYSRLKKDLYLVINWRKVLYPRSVQDSPIVSEKRVNRVFSALVYEL